MNLCEFLHFNQNCPVCGEPLKLYMQVNDGPLWKAQKLNSNEWYFDQFKMKDKDLENDDFLWLTEQERVIDINFSTAKIYQKSKTWTLFFFFMCNEDGIEDTPHEGYGINPYTGCYFRSTPFLEFKQNSNQDWRLTLANEFDPITGNIRDEIFTFKSNQANGNEKVYILNIDYENDKTILRYYTVSPEERVDKNFEPKVFRKDLPLLNIRPNYDLESRSQLISRLDNWILMS